MSDLAKRLHGKMTEMKLWGSQYGTLEFSKAELTAILTALESDADLRAKLSDVEAECVTHRAVRDQLLEQFPESWWGAIPDDVKEMLRRLEEAERKLAKIQGQLDEHMDAMIDAACDAVSDLLRVDAMKAIEAALKVWEER